MGGAPGSSDEQTTARPQHTWPPGAPRQPIQERTNMATPPEESLASVGVAGDHALFQPRRRLQALA
eukprot:3251038-Pyramimonas_sp.AAC.1